MEVPYMVIVELAWMAFRARELIVQSIFLADTISVWRV